MLNPADTSKAQWDQIVAILKSEMGSGRLKNVAWTNAAGQAQTSTLGDVRRSLHLYTQQPAGTASCGVQLSKYSVVRDASSLRKMTTEFTIQVAVQALSYAVGATTYPANGDDALAQAWAFVSDGNGNGISEILRDPNNRTLGNNAMTTILSAGVPVLSIGDGETPQIWADIYLTLIAEMQVSIG